MITFAETTLEQSRSLFDRFISSLTGLNDDFWEGHVLDSIVYEVQLDGRPIGMVGIHSGENMTFFYVPPSEQRYAQQAFVAALESLHPQYAFVPTNDELFLSLCMDNHKVVEEQAYFFRHDGAPVRPPEWPRELFRVAEPVDEADIVDDEDVAENIRLGKYYVLRKDGVYLGWGFFNPLQLVPNTAAIGMGVHPDHRRKGMGRSIITHLADICREKGLTPVCGCGYTNHNSKRTLESAGFVTRTRLLKVWFIDRPGE